MSTENPYAHLIGKSVIATAKRFTFIGALRHAEEVSVPGALEIVTPDGEVDFGGMPEVFDSIKELECPGMLSDGEGVPGLCGGPAGHEGDCYPATP